MLSDPARRRIALATVCLIVGVSLAVDDNPCWQVVGFLLLLFVPASIYDAVTYTLGTRATQEIDTVYIQLAEGEIRHRES